MLLLEREVGESGTPHQGYAELSCQMRFNRVKKKSTLECFFAKRRGSQKEAIDYCKKGQFICGSGRSSCSR